MDSQLIFNIVTGIAGILAASKWIGDYMSRHDSNETNLKLKEMENSEASLERLQKKYEELQAKCEEYAKTINKLTLSLDRAITSFEMLLPVLQDEFSDREDILSIINRAQKNITRNEDAN
jgi:flagellar capping protein FliD